MSNDNRRHVVPDGADGWKVVAPGAKRASATASTQAEARKRADQIVRNAGGGEVVTHGKNGQIRNSNTIAPGNDPFPPRDKK